MGEFPDSLVRSAMSGGVGLKRWNLKLLYTTAADNALEHFNPIRFHLKCDDMGPTLTIAHIRLPNGRQLYVGGYTGSSWTHRTGFSPVTDPHQCIFIFGENAAAAPTVLRAKPGAPDGHHNHMSKGPCFGRSELWIPGQLAEKGECKNLGHTYGDRNDPQMAKFSQLMGDKGFNIINYEVFSVLKKNRLHIKNKIIRK